MLDEAVDLFREDTKEGFKDVKNLLGSSQQQCPPAGSKQTHVSYFISE